MVVSSVRVRWLDFFTAHLSPLKYFIKKELIKKNAD